MRCPVHKGYAATQCAGTTSVCCLCGTDAGYAATPCAVLAYLCCYQVRLPQSVPKWTAQDLVGA
eukprot:3839796-Rhodomonas_salina.1